MGSFRAGPSARLALVLDFWSNCTVDTDAEPDPPLQPLKVFTAKNKLPAVQDYKSTANNDFWAAFPHNQSSWGFRRCPPHGSGPGQTWSAAATTLG